MDERDYKKLEPEDMGFSSKEENGQTEQEPEIDNPELAGFRVELPKTATFRDLVDDIGRKFGNEAVKKVEDEIAWQAQQFDDFDYNVRIVDFFQREGHDLDSIEGWLPIRFKQ